MTDVYMQPASINRDREVLEMQAFEKGRLQGELEATRRMEADHGHVQKQMLPTEQELAAINNLQRPDVVEINRLTWPQRAAWVLGELSLVAMLATTIYWIENYRIGVGWSSDRAHDDIGNHGMYQTMFLTMVLGLWFLSQAISNYRILPLNTAPWINRSWYILMQLCAHVCWALAMTANVRSYPDAVFWNAADWCFALAFAVTCSHGLYSIVHTLLEPARYKAAQLEFQDGHHQVAHGTHAANGGAKLNHSLLQSPEQRRDQSTHNQFGRSVYTPAPVHVHSNGLRTAHSLPLHGAGSNVPAAPANAPRWAENPNTHAEDYWLLPRVKWAIVGYWSMACAVLMHIALNQAVIASGRDMFAQSTPFTEEERRAGQMGENSNEATLIGIAGLVTLFAISAISYMAMPPRTEVIKNGILLDQTRRSSVSQNQIV